MEDQVAILWDVENVTPSADSIFLEGFLDYSSKFGKFSFAQAFADWTNPSFTKLSKLLSRENFQMIHTPIARRGKNSSDISLVTYGMETMLHYAHISHYVLITGDSDFRSLVQVLKRNGRGVSIICDAKTADETLLEQADDFIDYRKLIQSREENEPQPTKKIEQNASYWFKKLPEAINALADEGKKAGLGLVNIKLRILYSSFNLKKLRFKKWIDFVEAASAEGYVNINSDQGSIYLTTAKKEKTAFDLLFAKVHPILKGKNELLLSQIGLELAKQKVQLDKYGYKKLKEFIQVADARNLVNTRVENLNMYVSLAK